MWILDTDSSNHLVSLSSFPKRPRGAIEQNAYAVRLAIAIGILEVNDVIDVDIQSLGAKVRVFVLRTSLPSFRSARSSRTTGAP